MPPYYPHLSLFYGQNTPPIVSKIQEAVKQTKMEGHKLTIDQIDLYSIIGDSGSWIHLGSFPFEGIFSSIFLISEISFLK